MSTIIPFCTLKELKAWLPVRVNDATYDMRLKSVILSATSQITHLTQRDFSYGLKSQFFNSMANVQRRPDWSSDSSVGTGFSFDIKTGNYILRGCPIDMNQPVVMWFDPGYTWTDDKKLAPDADFVVDPGVDNKNPKVIILNGVYTYPRSIRVDYYSGYQVIPVVTDISVDPTCDPGDFSQVLDVDEDLHQAVLNQSIYNWIKSSPENIGITDDRTLGSISATGRGTKALTSAFVKNAGVCAEAIGLLRPYVRTVTGRH